MIQLFNGDCLEQMKKIPDGSVDLVLTDPPYGTVNGLGGDIEKYSRLSNSSWDIQLNTTVMFKEINRVLRMNGCLILFAQEPYTCHLISNMHGNIPFSYKYFWNKGHFANCLLANKAPVSYIEEVVVFFKKYDTQSQHPLRNYAKKLFNFIGKDKKLLFAEMGHQGVCHFMRYDSLQFGLCTEKTYTELCDMCAVDKQSWYKEFSELEEISRSFSRRFSRRFNLPEGKKYKSNVLEYKKDYSGLHPTQKPVALIEDLIKTYTNEGETVLDFTMGSGTTGVACKNLNRNFIGIELDPEYFEIAKKRIESVDKPATLFENKV